MIRIEKINDFEFHVLKVYAGDEKNIVGYIEYYQEIGKGGTFMYKTYSNLVFSKVHRFSKSNTC